MPLRKRIKVNTPPEVTVTGGGGGAPTAQLAIGPDFGENVGNDGITNAITVSVDDISHDFAGTLNQTVTIDDESHNFAGTLNQTVTIDDESHNFAGQLNQNISMPTVVLQANNHYPQHDTWLDEANPTTTHGSDTTLGCKNDTASGVVDDDQNAYIAWDFTNINTSSQINSSGATFTFWASSNDAVVTQTLRGQYFINATQPFVESTATWNNTEQPPGSPQGVPFTVSVAPGAAQQFTVNWETNFTNVPGDWGYVRFTGHNTTLTLTRFLISSKEHSTQKPYFTWSDNLS